METGAPEQWKTLIVDDDAFIGRLVQLRLQTSGFVSDIVVNGEAALAKLSENAYDLIFLDVFLPDIGGLDLLGRIRAIDHDIGIIVMTASSTARTAIDALRNGADDYLRKPFEPEEFAAVLKRTTDRVRLRARMPSYAPNSTKNAACSKPTWPVPLRCSARCYRRPTQICPIMSFLRAVCPPAKWAVISTIGSSRHLGSGT